MAFLSSYGAAVKSIQSGTWHGTPGDGSGTDRKYCDISISAVVVAKCFVVVRGQLNSDQYGVVLFAGNLAARLSSGSNLRVSSPSSQSANNQYPANVMSFTWQVVEFY